MRKAHLERVALFTAALAAAALFACLGDLDGTLCDPGGTCVDGYHCDTSAQDGEAQGRGRCRAGAAPRDAGGTDQDAGVDAGSDAGEVDAGAPDAGPRPDAGSYFACTGPDECAADETCHFLEKVCVRTCTSELDCPENWLCSVGDGLCACPAPGAMCVAADRVCNEESRVCSAVCATTSDCAVGFDCKPGSGGQCLSPRCNLSCGPNEVCSYTAQGAEECNPACVFGSCGAGASCGTDGRCRRSQSCGPSMQQPGACGNGAFCDDSVARCSEVPAPTCSNVQAHGTTWTPAAKQPVIYEVLDLPVISTFCDPLTHKNLHLEVRAYWVDGIFPPTNAELHSMLHYVRKDGTQGQLSSVFKVVRSPDQRHVTFEIGFCFLNSETTATVGLHFENVGGLQSNFYCKTSPI